MSYDGDPHQHFGCVSYSQHGEDLMLLNLFKQLEIDKPSYLDLGAHHPVTLSNTNLMYLRGSRGVNIEANPNLIQVFLRERPEDKTINVGVGVQNGTAPFYMFDPHSGRNTFCLEEAHRFSEESGKLIRETKEIPVKTISSIVDEYCDGRFPHFLNCDIEGLDHLVLTPEFWSMSNRPVIICVETRLDDSQKMTAMMWGGSYLPYCRMGENILYISNENYPILMKTLGTNA